MKNNGFCRFYKSLYVGESIKHPRRVRWKLVHGAGQFTVFCITGSLTEIDQLEIQHCAFLKQPWYREHPAFIYGIAGSYEAAMDLIVKISDEAIGCGLPGQLRAYLDRNTQ